jgi:hypothetical protein
MNYLKNSGQPFAFQFVNRLTCSMPVIFQQAFNDFLISRATAVISNAPGPRINTNICGQEMIQAVGFPPFLGDLGVGICTNTVGQNITVCITADEALVP